MRNLSESNRHTQVGEQYGNEECAELLHSVKQVWLPCKAMNRLSSGYSNLAHIAAEVQKFEDSAGFVGLIGQARPWESLQTTKEARVRSAGFVPGVLTLICLSAIIRNRPYAAQHFRHQICSEVIHTHTVAVSPYFSTTACTFTLRTRVGQRLNFRHR
jgi:hypothetical protein